MVGLYFIEAELFKIKDAMERMAFVTGHTDFFLGNIPVKIIQLILFTYSDKRFFLLKISGCFAGLDAVNGQLLFSIIFYKNSYSGNIMCVLVGCLRFGVIERTERLTAKIRIFSFFPIKAECGQFFLFKMANITDHRPRVHVQKSPDPFVFTMRIDRVA